jgi:hypothetical protein
MVELQKNVYSWGFLFMGVNIDTFGLRSNIKAGME